MNDINNIIKFVQEKQIEQQLLLRRQQELKQELSNQEKLNYHLVQAAELIRQTQTQTHQQIKYQIAEAGTLILKTIFENPPKIHIEFETKRNQTECKILFEKNGQMYLPTDENGLGAADIAGFGLRIAIWSLPARPTSCVIIMDEPFKHLKGSTANKLAIQAVKRISREFDMQIIMVSDERVSLEEIEKGADRIFKVSMVNDVSKLEVS